MGSHCCGPPVERVPTPGFRRVLIVALAINAVMFLVEVGAGLIAGSLSLQADALDFLGDAGNYALTLFVLGMTLKARATAALVKGATMVVLGVFVLVQGVVHAVTGGVADMFQLFTRPVARLNPYSTPNPRVFLCSASTPPGGGVHGMCGFYAAESALRSGRSRG